MTSVRNKTKSMTSASSNVVFDDIFTINAIDKDGKKFDRGAVVALSPTMNAVLILHHQCHVCSPTRQIMTWT